ncbi:MAG: 23S rRNA (guanosine(2251)-2'-O)-methyltransferase RlmB [Tissierellia bacterium]|nr:23S rRNA (guanosine(2251)-2'-O)-methyltransferase RlmB [Tissierellia bacterium]
MKSEIIYGRKPILENLGEQTEILYIQKGLTEGSMKKIIGRARALGIEVKEREKGRLDEMTGGANHQGVVAYTSDFEYSEVSDILAQARAKGEDPFLLLLEHITDPHNLGAIIRSAKALGAHGVIIPKNRSARVNGTVFKTSAGAVDQLPVARVTNLKRVVEELKGENIWIYGAEMGGGPAYGQNLTGPIALVIGSEDKGISESMAKHLDGRVAIPMAGFDSLNASCAASILLYEVLRQRRAAEV